MYCVEVDQISKSDPGKAKVGQQLGMKDWRQRFNSLKFYNDAIINEKVAEKPRFKNLIIIFYRDVFLSFNPYPLFVQFIGKGFFINRFEQSWPKN
jgi:hypothetical protein